MRLRHCSLCIAPVILSVGLAASQPIAPDLKIDRITQDDGVPTQPVTSVQTSDIRRQNLTAECGVLTAFSRRGRLLAYLGVAASD